MTYQFKNIQGEHTAVEIYQLLLDGSIARFPFGFLRMISQEEQAKIVRYLICSRLKLTSKQICEQVSISFFQKYRLSGLLQTHFQNSPYQLLNAAFPNRFKPWQLKRAPINSWTLENAIAAIQWLIDDKLQLCEKDLCKVLSVNLFKENGLYAMLILLFHSKPAAAINAAYPDKFHIAYIKKQYVNLKNAA